ncbi:MAG: hypothetical protein OXG46_14280 [Chloroflexi bacterium]|nr:hypothetical protein [Chloroflexota bacterium]MCY3939005.1 hypothetical protein [Chloroflexota bacterium]
MKTPRKAAIALLVMLAAMVPQACDAGRDSAGGSRALELNAFVMAADLAVGVNRFPFVLVDTNGEAAVEASVRAKFAKLGEDGTPTVKSSGEAVFVSVTSEFLHVHEDGIEHIHEHVEGVYVVNGVDFDEAGFWEAEFEVRREGIGTTTASAAFEVRERPIAPGVGEIAPASLNPTVRDVEDLYEISTHPAPVAGLYQLTIAEALEQRKPLVVAFSTPAFCVSRACGPVTDLVASLYEGYGDRINFIHIEPWVLETARGEGRLVLTDVAKEWRLMSEPWVFVIDGEGRVASRFEGFLGEEELVEALEAVVP